ncbi:hypothetical protein C8R43DRAFT_953842 [Mycena crocata]|nr:hypothetical protein C8R43DRAFT_953842 [Mycena crocata]
MHHQSSDPSVKFSFPRIRTPPPPSTYLPPPIYPGLPYVVVGDFTPGVLTTPTLLLHLRQFCDNRLTPGSASRESKRSNSQFGTRDLAGGEARQQTGTNEEALWLTRLFCKEWLQNRSISRCSASCGAIRRHFSQWFWRYRNPDYFRTQAFWPKAKRLGSPYTTKKIPPPRNLLRMNLCGGFEPRRMFQPIVAANANLDSNRNTPVFPRRFPDGFRYLPAEENFQHLVAVIGGDIHLHTGVPLAFLSGTVPCNATYLPTYPLMSGFGRYILLMVPKTPRNSLGNSASFGIGAEHAHLRHWQAEDSLSFYTWILGNVISLPDPYSEDRRHHSNACRQEHKN